MIHQQEVDTVNSQAVRPDESIKKKQPRKLYFVKIKTGDDVTLYFGKTFDLLLNALEKAVLFDKKSAMKKAKLFKTVFPDADVSIVKIKKPSFNPSPVEF